MKHHNQEGNSNKFDNISLAKKISMTISCWKPIVEGGDGDVKGKVDGLLWYKDLGNHLYGEFSMAVIQANSSLEDRSQFESGPMSSDYLGPQGTFIGVYDGHGGTAAAQFVNENLFSNFKSMFSTFITNIYWKYGFAIPCFSNELYPRKTKQLISSYYVHVWNHSPFSVITRVTVILTKTTCDALIVILSKSS